MKHVVVHDLKGNIVSVARGEPSADPGLLYGLAPRLKKGQAALEVEVAAETARLLPSEIKARYRVDVKAKQLTPRTKTKGAKGP